MAPIHYMSLPLTHLARGVLLLAATALSTIAASIGQSEIDVRRAHGKASSTMVVGSKKILAYPTGKVTIVGGKVVEVTGDLDVKGQAATTPAPIQDGTEQDRLFEKKSSSTSSPQHIAKFNTQLVNASGKPIADPGLADKKYILVYYSASWCPPCRTFTPKLVQFYNEHKKGDNFELVFVSADRNASDTTKYMKNYKMPWPAIRFQHIGTSGLENQGGPGIPSLVLFDQKGKVVSHTYKREHYLGPDKVLKDLKKRI